MVGVRGSAETPGGWLTVDGKVKVTPKQSTEPEKRKDKGAEREWESMNRSHAHGATKTTDRHKTTWTLNCPVSVRERPVGSVSGYPVLRLARTWSPIPVRDLP